MLQANWLKWKIILKFGFVPLIRAVLVDMLMNV